MMAVGTCYDGDVSVRILLRYIALGTQLKADSIRRVTKTRRDG